MTISFWDRCSRSSARACRWFVEGRVEQWFDMFWAVDRFWKQPLGKPNEWIWDDMSEFGGGMLPVGWKSRMTAIGAWMVWMSPYTCYEVSGGFWLWQPNDTKSREDSVQVTDCEMFWKLGWRLFEAQLSCARLCLFTNMSAAEGALLIVFCLHPCDGSPLSD